MTHVHPSDAKTYALRGGGESPLYLRGLKIYGYFSAVTHLDLTLLVCWKLPTKLKSPGFRTHLGLPGGLARQIPGLAPILKGNLFLKKFILLKYF